MELARGMAVVSVIFLVLMAFMSTTGTARQLLGGNGMGAGKGGHFQGGRRAAPSANIPADAGGRALVRHNSSHGGCPRHNL
jgi:hypothetical protein